MIRSLSNRFWIELILATLTGILFVITLLWRDWIEIIFKIDPDQGSGTIEWVILLIFLLAIFAFIALAGYEWRKARTT